MFGPCRDCPHQVNGDHRVSGRGELLYSTIPHHQGDPMNKDRRSILGVLMGLFASTLGLGRATSSAIPPQICDKNCPVKGCGSSCFEEKNHKGAHICRLNNHRF